MKKRENVTENEALEALNLQLLLAQKRLADWLNDKCRNLPARALMVILIIFCSCSASLLLMLIMGKIK
jgi:hypothetical protein